MSHDVQFLDLSSQGLTEVPDHLWRYSDIKFLYLSGNKLKSLPTELFTKLPKLEWLDIRDNFVTQIPAAIGNLKQLRSLLLNNNQITALPSELAQCTKLTGLHISGNDLEYPPAEVCKGTCESILKWLRKQTTEPSASPSPDKQNRRASQYDLWSTPLRTRGGRFGKPRRVPLTRPRSVRSQQSSAYLARDDTIKLRMPKLPTEEDILRKAKLRERRAARQSQRASNLAELERLQKLDVDDEWKDKLQQDKMRRAWLIETGQETVLPPDPPFGVIGDSLIPRTGDSQRWNETMRSTALASGETRLSETDIQAIRAKVHNLVGQMDNSRLSDVTTDSQQALAQAEKNFRTLKQLGQDLHKPF